MLNIQNEKVSLEGVHWNAIVYADKFEVIVLVEVKDNNFIVRTTSNGYLKQLEETLDPNNIFEMSNVKFI